MELIGTVEELKSTTFFSCICLSLFKTGERDLLLAFWIVRANFAEMPLSSCGGGGGAGSELGCTNLSGLSTDPVLVCVGVLIWFESELGIVFALVARSAGRFCAGLLLRDLST